MEGEGRIARLVKLGPEAITYMREELVHPDPLADVLQKLPLEAGHITTYVPNQTSMEEIYTHRAVFRSPKVEVWPAIKATEDFIYRYLHQGGSWVWIMGRHPALSQDYRGLKLTRLGRDWSDWFTCEGWVYFYATEICNGDMQRRYATEICNGDLRTCPRARGAE
jgi:hypothetical protein